MSNQSAVLSELLSGVESGYELPDDNLVGEVLMPALEVADHLRIGSGYFSAGSFALLAGGLAAFLARSGEAELLLSIEVSQEEFDAFASGANQPEVVIREFVDQETGPGELSENALANHTLQCLSYLIATERLEVRFALKPAGSYHKKMWFFSLGDETVAVHGSANVTCRGLFGNGEQMTIDRPTDGEAARDRIRKFQESWEADWGSKNPDSTLTLTVPEATNLIRERGSSELPPTIDDFWDAWRRDHENGLSPPPPEVVGVQEGTGFHVPRELQPRPDGEWRHQAHAVQAWIDSGMRGILAMATGAGKTIASLVCARRLCDTADGPVLIVVAVPTDPLVRQWVAQIEGFGVKPVAPTLLGSRQKKQQAISSSLGLLHKATPDEPCIMVITNELLCDRIFQTTVERSINRAERKSGSSVPALLIGDECHRLGREKFVSSPPEFFSHRLGLSATPIREHDPDGTEALIDYFGETVFEFSLKDAIGLCLVPYRYHVHFADLDLDELTEFQRLTVQIGKAYGASADEESNVGPTALIMQRRAVLEDAASKPDVLREIFETDLEGKSGVFVYCSAKAESQLPAAAAVLRELGVVPSKITASEESKDRQEILRLFEDGTIPVVLAKRILDEGIDVPSATTAVILASSTVEREWIQRRGRVLRTAPGKTSADIYDVFALPPKSEVGNDEVGKIVSQELKRVREFSERALNNVEVLGVIDEVIRDYFPI